MILLSLILAVAAKPIPTISYSLLETRWLALFDNQSANCSNVPFGPLPPCPAGEPELCRDPNLVAGCEQGWSSSCSAANSVLSTCLQAGGGPHGPAAQACWDAYYEILGGYAGDYFTCMQDACVPCP